MSGSWVSLGMPPSVALDTATVLSVIRLKTKQINVVPTVQHDVDMIN